VVSAAPDDGFVDAKMWNRLIEVLLDYANQHEGMSYGRSRKRSFEVQLCLEIICALGRKTLPIGAWPVPYAKLLPSLSNPDGFHTGSKDLMLPLDEIGCPYLDEDNFLHDLDVLTVYFETKGKMINPCTGFVFSEDDQLRLLRFPKIRYFFQCKLDCMEVIHICPSPEVLECLFDIGGALTGGKISPSQHGVKFSGGCNKDLNIAKGFRNTSCEEAYDTERMGIMHRRRKDLQVLLETTCQDDIWILSTPFWVVSDLKRFWATIDEVIEEAMYETDVTTFSGTCQGGMGSSMIDWCIDMREKARGGDPNREYNALRRLLKLSAGVPDCIMFFELTLPKGTKAKDVELPKPTVIELPPPDQTVEVQGINLCDRFDNIERGKNPRLTAGKRDVTFTCKTGGVYYLKEISGGPSWAAMKYLFELIEVEHEPELVIHIEPKESTASLIEKLLQKDDLEGACQLLIMHEGEDWTPCMTLLVSAVYEEAALTERMIKACAGLSPERLGHLIEYLLVSLVCAENPGLRKGQVRNLLRSLGLYSTKIEALFR